MIRITVELVPRGHEHLKYELARAEITNTGRGTKTRGAYKAWFSQRRRLSTPWKEVEVEDFPRTRLGIWYLVYTCLKEAIHGS